VEKDWCLNHWATRPELEKVYRSLPRIKDWAVRHIIEAAWFPVRDQWPLSWILQQVDLFEGFMGHFQQRVLEPTLPHILSLSTDTWLSFLRSTTTEWECPYEYFPPECPPDFGTRRVTPSTNDHTPYIFLPLNRNITNRQNPTWLFLFLMVEDSEGLRVTSWHDSFRMETTIVKTGHKSLKYVEFSVWLEWVERHRTN